MQDCIRNRPKPKPVNITTVFSVFYLLSSKSAPLLKDLHIPENAIVSASGITWLDSSGIIIAIGKDHAIHTLAHALENHRVNVELAGGIRRPFLIDMTDVKSMSHEARTFYAGPEPPKVITAVAIITNSTLSKLVANFFMTLGKPVLPTRMFTSIEEATEWLSQYLEPA